MESKKNAVYIDTDSLISSLEDEAVQALVCQVCLGVVYHPVECYSCETLFCSAEIDQFKGVCPLCKGEKWKQTEYIHRSYKSKLLNLQLRCPAATCPLNKDKLSYEKYIKHVPTCEFVVFKAKPYLPAKSEVVEGVADRKYYQFVYAYGLGTKPYSEPDNISLNLNYHNKTKQFELGTYLINLETKEQLNQATKNRRPIRIEYVVAHKPKYWWYTSTEKNEFSMYSLESQNGIESSYRQFLKNKRPTIHKIRISGRYYTIDLEKMLQVNAQNKKVRQVHRVMI